MNINEGNTPKDESKKSNYNWLFSFIIVPFIFFGYKFYKNYSAKNVAIETEINNQQIENKNQNSTNQDLILAQLRESVDISDNNTKDYASQLAAMYPGTYNVGQVANIFDYVVYNWKYVNDSRGKEDFRKASRTIKNNLTGDCDDFAILMAALIESIGGTTRISFAYNAQGEGHAFAEVLATDRKEDIQLVNNLINEVYGENSYDINFSQDEAGKCWLNLDWFGEPKHLGGKYFDFVKRTIYYPTESQPYFINE